MSLDWLPFTIHIDPVLLSGVGIWALALYLGFSPVSDWLMEQLVRWFNHAERSLYTSAEEYERTRQARESQNSFYASLFSIIPFLGAGTLLHYGVELSLGRSWSISVGILSAMGAAVYELGRRDGEAEE